MTAEVIVALIMSGGTLIGIFIQNKSHNESITKLLEYRLSLSEASNERNTHLLEQIAEKLHGVEQKTEILDERQKTANHRIDDLERSQQNGR